MRGTRTAIWWPASHMSRFGHLRPIGGDHDRFHQRAGRRAQGHRQVRGPSHERPTSCQLRVRLGVSNRQHRTGHARDPNPLGSDARSDPAARETADQASLQDLPALTLASPGMSCAWRSTLALVVPHMGMAVEAEHHGAPAPGGVAWPRRMVRSRQLIHAGASPFLADVRAASASAASEPVASPGTVGRRDRGRGFSWLAGCLGAPRLDGYAGGGAPGSLVGSCCWLSTRSWA
jgi:hypothetical protein